MRNCNKEQLQLDKPLVDAIWQERHTNCLYACSLTKKDKIGPKKGTKKWSAYKAKKKTLFVFSINGLNQNTRSLLTKWHISVTDFHAPLLNGSSNNHLIQRFWLAVEEFWPIRKWLKKLPWRAKPRLPCERAWKAGSETGVKSDLAFCLGSLIEKTNSVWDVHSLVNKANFSSATFRWLFKVWGGRYRHIAIYIPVG